MGKYSALAAYLTERASPVVADIALVDRWVDGLPARAHSDTSWWSNDAGLPQSGAWLNAGWRVQSVDLVGGRVTFESLLPQLARASRASDSSLSDSFRSENWQRLAFALGVVAGLGGWYGLVRDVLGDAVTASGALTRTFGIQWPDILLWSMFVAIVGGGMWAFTLREYRVFGGSFDTEPHGRLAFGWGLVTFFPIAVSVSAACVFLGLVGIVHGVAMGITANLAYAIAGRLFYGGRTPAGSLGWRRVVEARVEGRIAREVLISSAWSLLLTAAAVVPTAVLLLGGQGLDGQALTDLVLAMFLGWLPALTVCVTAVALTPPGEVSDALRGPLAAIALRTGVALALVMVIATRIR